MAKLTILVAAAVNLVVIAAVAIVWSILSARASLRYRRRDARDILHYLARRRERGKRR